MKEKMQYQVPALEELKLNDTVIHAGPSDEKLFDPLGDLGGL